ncbi:MAG: DUF4405 domain-containing protein [Planctomycetota bacterium]
MGLGKDQWESLHINGALFLVLAGLLHVVLNWTIFWGYIKKRGSPGLNITWELFFAVVLGGVVVAGSLFGFAPFRSVVDLHDSIKDSWGGPPGRGGGRPAPAATLREVSREMHLSSEQMLAALEAQGLEVPGIEATLREVAERNDLSPEEVRALVQEQFPDTSAGAGRGAGGPGGGRGDDGGRGLGGGQEGGAGGGGARDADDD